MLLTLKNWREFDDIVVINAVPDKGASVEFCMSLTNPEHVSHIKRWHDECRGENSCLGKVFRQLLDELMGEQVFIKSEE